MSKMLNQSAIEALYSATYLEDYLDAMENVPDDVQRQMTRMREQDLTYQNHLRDLEASMSLILDGDLDLLTKKKTYFRIQQLLMNAQDVGDEKLQIMQQVQDLVDNKARQLELDKKNLDFGRDENEMGLSSRDSRFHGESISNIKRARRARHDVIVPSILGPSILEATSFSENHNSSNIDSGGNDDNVVTITSGKGRGKAQRESQHSHSTKGTPVADRDRDSSTHTPAHTTASTHAQSTPSTSSNSQQQHNATPSSSSHGHGHGTTASSSKKSHSNNPAVVAHEISSSSSQSTGHHHEKTSTSSTNTPATTVSLDATPGSSQRSTAVSALATPRKQQHHKQQQHQQQQQSEKKVKQKRKSKQATDNSPIPIDPDEPTYCLCDQVSYGEMIGCDNDLCPIEWFHFSCVSLSTKPKGKWFCPKCRGDRPNIMKQKTVFLKELEKYNKEKEEKS